jgi:hypothetical protein
MPRRDDVLHDPSTLGGDANRLLMVLPMRVVRHWTTHSGQPRHDGQFHQAFQLELTLKPFRQGFTAP